MYSDNLSFWFIIYQKTIGCDASLIFVKNNQRSSNRLETSILPDQEGLPDTDNNSDDDILEDTIPSSSSRRLESRDDEMPIIDPVENTINDNESQTQLIPEQDPLTNTNNNGHTNSYKNHTSHHFKYILFLIYAHQINKVGVYGLYSCKIYYILIFINDICGINYVNIMIGILLYS